MIDKPYIFALDPSGDWPGGTTGVCSLSVSDAGEIAYETWTIKPEEGETQLQYWDKIVDTFTIALRHTHAYLVIEDFILYAHKAGAQSWSGMDTSRLLGILQYRAYEFTIPIHWQRAADVKKRWSDEILEHKGLIVKKGRRWYNPNNDEPMVDHERDALRHAVHYHYFGKDK